MKWECRLTPRWNGPGILRPKQEPVEMWDPRIGCEGVSPGRSLAQVRQDRQLAAVRHPLVKVYDSGVSITEES